MYENIKEMKTCEYKDAPSYYEVDYTPLSRIIFSTDRRDVEFFKYQIDPTVQACVVPKRGAVPLKILENEECIVPTFLIATNPTWKFEEEKKNPNLAELAKKKATASIFRQEDVEMCKTLETATIEEHTFTIYKEDFQKDSSIILGALTNSFGCLLEREFSPYAICMHPHTFFAMTLINNKHLYINKDNLKDVYIKGTQLGGSFLDVPILINPTVPTDRVYITSSPYTTGVMPIKQDVTPTDVLENHQKFRKELIVSDEVGFGVLNDSAHCKIVFEDAPKIREEIVTVPIVKEDEPEKEVVAKMPKWKEILMFWRK